MAPLSRAEVVQKFNTCTGTQEAIETVSQWIIFHRNQAKEIVDIWCTECQNAPLKRIVIYFYIANDVIQNARKKAPIFTQLFFDAFNKLFAAGLLLKCDEKKKDSIRRVIQILEDRGCFTLGQVTELHQTMSRASESTLPRIFDTQSPTAPSHSKPSKPSIFPDSSVFAEDSDQSKSSSYDSRRTTRKDASSILSSLPSDYSPGLGGSAFTSGDSPSFTVEEEDDKYTLGMKDFVLDVSNYLSVDAENRKEEAENRTSLRKLRDEDSAGVPKKESLQRALLACKDHMIENAKDMLGLLKEATQMMDSYLAQHEAERRQYSEGDYVVSSDAQPRRGGQLPEVPADFVFPGRVMKTDREEDNSTSDTPHLLPAPHRELHWEKQKREKELDRKGRMILEALDASDNLPGTPKGGAKGIDSFLPSSQDDPLQMIVKRVTDTHGTKVAIYSPPSTPPLDDDDEPYDPAMFTGEF